MRLRYIKALTATIITLTLTTPAFCAVESVWGIPAGSAFDTVSSALSDRGCSMILDQSSLDFGRAREVLYRGDFFGRPCMVRVYFEGGKMKTFRLCFLNKDVLTSGDADGAMFGNYSDLTLKLRSKYGYDREIVSHGGGETQTWNVDGTRIVLACDGRSVSGHTTTLTYLFEEDGSVKP
ncbi:hypothetical protein L2W58_04205 [Dethiosulfovibrio sp. F2B]|uniref:hypothetical protein n=1 Tax=Dethiosulfovibrio faecalis TaxID=2720018 RepID=UPI001F354F6F|nr:hypothetical protein [Dethiosulfovibrio faecalis]MCF4150996.1 hypothetical protein [Dethiosulfovibrio faecalis]